VEGLGQKRVAGQQRNPFTENLMVGQLSPPEIIVVQGGQIVVNDGIGMDEFQGTGEREQVFMLPAKDLAGRQGQDRPEPFAAGKNAVMHRPIERLGLFFRSPQITLQGVIDQRPARF
jgi:hypothetical protein